MFFLLNRYVKNLIKTNQIYMIMLTHTYKHTYIDKHLLKHISTHAHTHMYIYCYIMFTHLHQLSGPVGWGRRIHRLHFWRGIRPHECPGYDIKRYDSEAPVMLELWGKRSTPSLPALSSLLWPTVLIAVMDVWWRLIERWIGGWKWFWL